MAKPQHPPLPNVNFRWDNAEFGSLLANSANEAIAMAPDAQPVADPAAIDQRVTATLVVVSRCGPRVRPLFVSRQQPSNISGPLDDDTPVAVYPLLVNTPHCPIVVVVVVIGDNLADPLRVEALLMPFEKSGQEVELDARVRFLLRARSLPVVLITPSSDVILAKDVPIPAARQEEMCAWEEELLGMTPRQVPQHEFVMAIRHYQGVTPMEQFGLYSAGA